MNAVFKRESALVLYGNSLLSASIGTYGSVDFDFESIWEFIKETSDFDKEKLHFIHSHPPGVDTYSSLDIQCMKALNMAFGFAINFWIMYCDIEGNPNLKRYKIKDGTVIEEDTVIGEDETIIGALEPIRKLLILLSCAYDSYIS